jgi:hypothetical protein
MKTLRWYLGMLIMLIGCKLRGKHPEELVNKALFKGTWLYKK